MGTCMVGWSHSRFGRLDGQDLEALIGSVTREALAHAGIGAGEVGDIWLGQLNGGFVPEIFASSLVLQASDKLRFKPTTRVENACATGSAAIRQGLTAIGAKRARVVLVVGVEKMTELSGPKPRASSATPPT